MCWNIYYNVEFLKPTGRDPRVIIKTKRGQLKAKYMNSLIYIILIIIYPNLARDGPRLSHICVAFVVTTWPGIK